MPKIKDVNIYTNLLCDKCKIEIAKKTQEMLDATKKMNFRLVKQLTATMHGNLCEICRVKVVNMVKSRGNNGL
jgi:uncharacterized protein YlaI